MNLEKLKNRVLIEGYLFNKESYRNLEKDTTKKKYLNLCLKSFIIKYAVRTLNQLLIIRDKEILKETFLKDLKSGSWTIDICDEENIDEYFKDNSIMEIQDDLIEFCSDWADNEIDCG